MPARRTAVRDPTGAEWAQFFSKFQHFNTAECHFIAWRVPLHHGRCTLPPRADNVRARLPVTITLTCSSSSAPPTLSAAVRPTLAAKWPVTLAKQNDRSRSYRGARARTKKRRAHAHATQDAWTHHPTAQPTAPCWVGGSWLTVMTAFRSSSSPRRVARAPTMT